MIVVGILELGSENDHNPVLQEVIIMYGIRI